MVHFSNWVSIVKLKNSGLKRLWNKKLYGMALPKYCCCQNGDYKRLSHDSLEIYEMEGYIEINAYLDIYFNGSMLNLIYFSMFIFQEEIQFEFEFDISFHCSIE